MQRTLVVGDLHIRASHLEEAKLVWSAILLEISEKNINRVVFLGDIYDGKAIIHADCQTLFLQLVKDISLAVNDIFILVGNHDFASTNLGNHSLYPLTELDNIHIVDTFKLYDNMAFIAYGSKDFMEKCLQEASRPSKNTAQYIFGHFSVEGFNYGNGHKADDGVNPNLIKCPALLGHFHTPSDTGNIHYVGSPYSISFGEANTHHLRRFGLIMDEGLSFIPLEKYNFPHHVIRDYEGGPQPKEDKSAIVKIINIPFDALDTVKKVCDNKFMSCSYISLPAFNGEVRLDAGKTNEDILKEYIDKDFLSNQFTKLDKKKLCRLGNELLQQED